MTAMITNKSSSVFKPTPPGPRLLASCGTVIWSQRSASHGCPLLYPFLQSLLVARITPKGISLRLLQEGYQKKQDNLLRKSFLRNGL